MTFLLQKGIFSRTKDQDFDMSFDGQVGKIHWRRESLPTPVFLGFPGGSAGKESTCNAGDLDWEDPLEKGKATHSSILAWRIPWTV